MPKCPHCNVFMWPQQAATGSCQACGTRFPPFSLSSASARSHRPEEFGRMELRYSRVGAGFKIVCDIVGTCAFGVFLYEDYKMISKHSSDWAALLASLWDVVGLVLLVLLPLIFLVATLAVTIHGFGRLTDRSVKLVIDSQGIRDLRTEEKTLHWGQVCEIRLRGERTNGLLAFALLTLELRSGGSIEFDIEGLDHSPESIFEATGGIFQSVRGR